MDKINSRKSPAKTPQPSSWDLQKTRLELQCHTLGVSYETAANDLWRGKSDDYKKGFRTGWDHHGRYTLELLKIWDENLKEINTD